MNCNEVSNVLSQLDLQPLSSVIKQHIETILYLRRERMGILFRSADQREEDELIRLIEKDNNKIAALNDLYQKLLEEGA